MRAILLSLAAVFGIAMAARADIIYQYVAEPAEVKVEAGKTVPVNIYLQETISGKSKSLLISEGGLFTGSVRLVRKSGDVEVRFKTNPAFDGPSNSQAIGVKNEGTMIAGVGLESTGVKATVSPKSPKVAKVLIGTATVKGKEPGESELEFKPYGGAGPLTMAHRFGLDASKKKGDKSVKDFPAPEDYTGVSDATPTTLKVTTVEKRK